MKQILIIGPDFHCYTDNIRQAFEKNGYVTRMIVYRWSGGIFHGFQDRKNVSLFNRSVKDAVSREHYDKIVVVRGSRIYDETLAAIKEKNIPIILFLQDTLENSGSVQNQLHFYNKILLFDRSDFDKLVKTGINSVYYGTPVSTQNYFPIANIVRDIDICFVGKLYDNRVELLEELVERFPDRKIQIVGQYIPKSKPSQWGRIYKYYFKNYRQCFVNANWGPEDTNMLYNRSKICLNIQHPQGQWSCGTRTMEISATRSFQISSTNPYMQKYSDQNGVVLYSTVADLLEKIPYYLYRSQERAEHALRGYNYALQHSYAAKMHLFDL